MTEGMDLERERDEEHERRITADIVTRDANVGYGPRLSQHPPTLKRTSNENI